MPNLDRLRALLDQRGNLASTETLTRPALQFSRVCTDSRQSRAGCLFVAHAGLTANGHDFVPQALQAGAVAVLGTETRRRFRDRCLKSGCAPVPYFQVKNSAAAMAQAAALAAGFPARDLNTAGITGTDGKTTTAALLASILRAPEGRKAGTEAEPAHRTGLICTLGVSTGGPLRDSGFHVTTPDAVQVQEALKAMKDAGCRYAVLECTSHGLDQSRVEETELSVAGVTNVAHEHLDYHGRFESYLAAKTRILGLLSDRQGVHAILNGDDEVSCDAMARTAAALNVSRAHPIETSCYSLRTERGCAYRGSNLTEDAAGMNFAMASPNGDPVRLQTSLWGEYNVCNALLAASMAATLGASPSRIRNGLAGFKGVPGRMERLAMGQPYAAIVDFAHSPQALENALRAIRRHLRLQRGGGRVIAVYGSAGLRDSAKRGLMGAVGARWADHVIITAEDPRTENLDSICGEIREGFETAGGSASCEIVPDRARAMERAAEMAEPGDAVAAFGKGHERSMCFGETEYPWSDRQALELAIARQLGLPSDSGHFVHRLPTR